uniref:Phosphatidylinositol-specific phospholipase C X domain-containing protein n=1 Tax=viral metagenome TaxID=1070528 RepID=A0A6C0CKT6_9ZZZZ
MASTNIPYNKARFLGTHNSYCNDSPASIATNKFKKMVLNQHKSIIEQLDAGIRVLDIEVHKHPFLNDLIVTHGPPDLGLLTGYTKFADILNVVKMWLEEHLQKSPDEYDKILTFVINPQKNVQNKKWYNDTVLKYFQNVGLDQYVYSYNEQRKDEDHWPLLKDMLDVGRPLMVFGLKGHVDFVNYQNYYRNDTDKILPTWDAKTIEDLDPSKLVLYPKPGNKIFLMYALCSLRDIDAYPYLFGGNPIQAKQVNRLKVIEPLVDACNEVLKEYNQMVNWIWIDFF